MRERNNAVCRPIVVEHILDKMSLSEPLPVKVRPQDTTCQNNATELQPVGLVSLQLVLEQVTEKPGAKAVRDHVRIAQETLSLRFVPKGGELRAQLALESSTTPGENNTHNHKTVFVDGNWNGTPPGRAELPAERLLPRSRRIHPVNRDHPVDAADSAELTDKNDLVDNPTFFDKILSATWTRWLCDCLCVQLLSALWTTVTLSPLNPTVRRKAHEHSKSVRFRSRKIAWRELGVPLVGLLLQSLDLRARHLLR
jgi:hypothetical protein